VVNKNSMVVKVVSVVAKVVVTVPDRVVNRTEGIVRYGSVPGCRTSKFLLHCWPINPMYEGRPPPHRAVGIEGVVEWIGTVTTIGPEVPIPTKVAVVMADLVVTSRVCPAASRRYQYRWRTDERIIFLLTRHQQSYNEDDCLAEQQ
jgi:hypothetical protein